MRQLLELEVQLKASRLEELLHPAKLRLSTAVCAGRGRSPSKRPLILMSAVPVAPQIEERNACDTYFGPFWAYELFQPIGLGCCRAN